MEIRRSKPILSNAVSAPSTGSSAPLPGEGATGQPVVKSTLADQVAAGVAEAAAGVKTTAVAMKDSLKDTIAGPKLVGPQAYGRDASGLLADAHVYDLGERGAPGTLVLHGPSGGANAVFGGDKQIAVSAQLDKEANDKLVTVDVSVEHDAFQKIADLSELILERRLRMPDGSASAFLTTLGEVQRTSASFEEAAFLEVSMLTTVGDAIGSEMPQLEGLLTLSESGVLHTCPHSLEVIDCTRYFQRWMTGVWTITGHVYPVLDGDGYSFIMGTLRSADLPASFLSFVEAGRDMTGASAFYSDAMLLAGAVLWLGLHGVTYVPPQHFRVTNIHEPKVTPGVTQTAYTAAHPTLSASPFFLPVTMNDMNNPSAAVGAAVSQWLVQNGWRLGTMRTLAHDMIATGALMEISCLLTRATREQYAIAAALDRSFDLPMTEVMEMYSAMGFITQVVRPESHATIPTKHYEPAIKPSVAFFLRDRFLVLLDMTINALLPRLTVTPVAARGDTEAACLTGMSSAFVQEINSRLVAQRSEPDLHRMMLRIGLAQCWRGTLYFSPAGIPTSASNELLTADRVEELWHVFFVWLLYDAPAHLIFAEYFMALLRFASPHQVANAINIIGQFTLDPTVHDQRWVQGESFAAPAILEIGFFNRVLAQLQANDNRARQFLGAVEAMWGMISAAPGLSRQQYRQPGVFRRFRTNADANRDFEEVAMIEMPPRDVTAVRGMIQNWSAQMSRLMFALVENNASVTREAVRAVTAMIRPDPQVVTSMCYEMSRIRHLVRMTVPVLVPNTRLDIGAGLGVHRIWPGCPPSCASVRIVLQPRMVWGFMSNVLTISRAERFAWSEVAAALIRTQICQFGRAYDPYFAVLSLFRAIKDGTIANPQYRIPNNVQRALGYVFTQGSTIVRKHGFCALLGSLLGISRERLFEMLFIITPSSNAEVAISDTYVDLAYEMTLSVFTQPRVPLGPVTTTRGDILRVYQAFDSNPGWGATVISLASARAMSFLEEFGLVADFFVGGVLCQRRDGVSLDFHRREVRRIYTDFDGNPAGYPPVYPTAQKGVHAFAGAAGSFFDGVRGFAVRADTFIVTVDTDGSSQPMLAFFAHDEARAVSVNLGVVPLQSFIIVAITSRAGWRAFAEYYPMLSPMIKANQLMFINMSPMLTRVDYHEMGVHHLAHSAHQESLLYVTVNGANDLISPITLHAYFAPTLGSAIQEIDNALQVPLTWNGARNIEVFPLRVLIDPASFEYRCGKWNSFSDMPARVAADLPTLLGPVLRNNPGQNDVAVVNVTAGTGSFGAVGAFKIEKPRS